MPLVRTSRHVTTTGRKVAIACAAIPDIRAAIQQARVVGARLLSALAWYNPTTRRWSHRRRPRTSRIPRRVGARDVVRRIELGNGLESTS